MKLVSPLLKRVLYPGLAQTGYLRRQAQNGPTVVTYHGVCPAGYRKIDPWQDGSLVSASALRSHIRLLQRNYCIISPQQFLEGITCRLVLPARSVLLSCDDGLWNNLTDMLPVLQECGVSCLFFVTGASAHEKPSILWYEELYLMLLTVARFSFELPEFELAVSVSSPNEKRRQWGGLLQKMSRFDQVKRVAICQQIRERLGLLDDWKAPFLTDSGARRFSLLTASQLRELDAAGMSIGAHTLSHPVLSQAPEEIAREEIVESRWRLEQVLGKPVWAFAYPFGDPASVTSREVRLAEEAGFHCAFMNAGGGFGAANSRFAFPRVHVTADMSLSEFEAHVSGFYAALRRRFADEERIGASEGHA
jgi:peptidoglycan/xylan/chitin deacetylase (PgdA/CDA1 family)